MILSTHTGGIALARSTTGYSPRRLRRRGDRPMFMGVFVQSLGKELVTRLFSNALRVLSCDFASHAVVRTSPRRFLRDFASSREAPLRGVKNQSFERQLMARDLTLRSHPTTHPCAGKSAPFPRSSRPYPAL